MQSPGPLRYAGLGIQLAATVVLGVLVGQWLDRKVGTDGIFTIVARHGVGLDIHLHEPGEMGPFNVPEISAPYQAAPSRREPR